MNLPLAESIRLISELVALDATSHRTNLALIDFVRDNLTALGLDSRIIRNDTSDPLKPGANGSGNQ